jgi:NAD(P)-dependent dehydrogenase (short-subunit alcohol dehydrogenase family)
LEAETMLLQDKIVLITGAAGDIGTGSARACYGEGAKLALADIDQKRLAEKAAEFDPSRVLLLPVDVRREDQVEEMVARTVEKYGRIDLFHNNAGTTGTRTKIVDTDLTRYRDWLDLNLVGFLSCMKHVLRQMYAQKGGAIVNTASQAAHRPSLGGSDYCLQKSAVLMLTKVAALESNGTGVRVNAVSPGYVESQMMRNNFVKFPNLEESIRKNVPLNRMCSPEEIGKVVAFLGSDHASYISGQEIGIDGGHLANYL